MERRITLGSLFDGIGGFPLCAEISGVQPIWAAEVDAACVAITRQHFPDMLHLGDVSKICGAEIPPVDIITFGSPCQDVSVAGKRKGIKHKDKGDEETTRSGLFFEAIRIIYEMREATNGRYPTFIVWENVPGAFASNNGHDFRTVLEEITKADIPMPASGKWAHAGMVRGGAICAAWRLLDAQYWGVPQRRKRIYLVGSFGSDSAAQILFKQDSVRRYLTAVGTPRERTSENAKASPAFGDKCYDARGNGNGNTAPTITGDHSSRVNDYCPIVLQAAGFHGWNSITAAGVELREESAPTLTARKQADVMIKAVKPPIGVDTYNQCLTGDKAKTLLAGHQDPDGLPCVVYALQGSMIGREDKNGPQGDGVNKDVCFTLNTIDRHAVVFALDRASFNQGANALYDFEVSNSGINSTIVAKGPSAVAYETIFEEFFEWVVRRLTPKECERLQGYPDFWTVLCKIENMTDEEYEFFKDAYLLDKRINGKTVKTEPTRKQLVRWYNKLDCDGTRYAQLGNSLAIPCALRVIGCIADYIREGQSDEI